MAQQFDPNLKLDVLAFGAHPDDIEFGCAGLLIKAKAEGRKIGIIDLTKSELSSNGTVELRQQEAGVAKNIIGADVRENLNFPDGFIFNSDATQKTIVDVIRKYQPTMVLFPYFNDRHPDHENTGRIIKHAVFLSGLKKFVTNYPSFRPGYALMYMMWNEFTPSVIFDITSVWDKKMEAMFAYQSQFVLKPGSNVTIDNKGDAEKFAQARARNYGFYINRDYGEPYLSAYPIGLNNCFDFLPNNF